MQNVCRTVVTRYCYTDKYIPLLLKRLVIKRVSKKDEKLASEKLI